MMLPARPFNLCLLLIFTNFIAFAHVDVVFGEQEVLVQNPAVFPDLYEASIAELQLGLDKGLFTSVDLVNTYIARIEEVNLKGPVLRAVLEVNPKAVEQAEALDLERLSSGPRGPLHGIPILLKDNMATANDGMNTTAGSFALLSSIVPRDAHVAKRLRDAGAILLGKTNLCEWSHMRGNLPSGFSGRGGQATNPYVPLGNPCGSSAGSGIGGAIGLAAAALGTETDGSIICPSSFNNLVGIKPTVGLTSRAGVIPITSHQDTVGPMARSVEDAAIILTAIAGRDPRDNYTLAQPEIVPDFTKALKANGLQGVRLGIPRNLIEVVFPNVNVTAAFNATLDIIRDLGATIVDPANLPDLEELVVSENESVVAGVDFKIEVAKYMQELLEVPTGVQTLADLIAFNLEHADVELPEPYWTSQSAFLEAVNTTITQAYFDSIAFNRELGGERGIDAALKESNLDALIMPSNAASGPAAIVGYPIVTVPLGFMPPDTPLAPAEPTRTNGPNMPFGISFVGTAFTEFQLISYAYAYEQATHNRLKVLAYPDAIPKTQLADIVGRRVRVDF